MLAKTYSAKPKDIKREWHLLDASTITLGRLSTIAATLLSGKHKPSYTPHIDGGDGVVIINSDKLKLTGKKLLKKRYYRHSGYPGSLKSYTAEQLLKKDSTKVIELAVKGMLPKNKLQTGRLARLRIYKDENHGLEAQNPKVYEVKNG